MNTDTDQVLNGFLEEQLAAGLELARSSEVLDLQRLPGDPPSQFFAAFHGRWLTDEGGGRIGECPLAVLHVRFPQDYLRSVQPAMIVSVFAPFNLWHPNIAAPMICLGAVPPGTGLVDLLFQCFEILAFHKFSPHSPLNPQAAQWARRQPAGRFPIDRRSLRGPAQKGGSA